MVPVARAPLAAPLSPAPERPWPSVYLLPALDVLPPEALSPGAPPNRGDSVGRQQFAPPRNPGWRVFEVPARGRPAPAPDAPWRHFWAAVVVTLVSFGLAFGTALADSGHAPSVLAVRVLGWPALLLPLAVLTVALRARGPGRRARPDAGLFLLGCVLEAAALVRLHAVLGLLVGAG